MAREGYLWQAIADDIDDVLALADELLPLDDLATGPTTDIGFDGPPDHHLFDLIVSKLDQHPGKGWPFIKTGLRNRTIRNRTMAIRALTAWTRATIPPAAADIVRDALAIEPDPTVATAMRHLLDTWNH